MTKRIPIAQVAYNAEWSLAKFLSALKNPCIQEKFSLWAVCGIEKSIEEALTSLEVGIDTRANLLVDQGEWRKNQRLEEIRSALGLIKKLASGEIKYFCVNGNDTLPEEIYENVEAIVIHSPNPLHLYYISDAVASAKHVLCEKPLIPVINNRGNIDGTGLKELEECVQQGSGLILMDAEHYSYKRASLTFYENLGWLLNGRKIRRIEGELKELDNPLFWRTREILSLKNRTGLLGDTMCHLLAFVSNLGGRPEPTGRKYASYEDAEVKYEVDTHDEVEYRISQNREFLARTYYFTDDATALFTVTKFIDRKVEPEERESKFIRFILDDSSEVIIDFKEGTVKKKGQEHEIPFRYTLSDNEYVNNLGHFYEAIESERNGMPKNPLTDFRNSIVTLKAIWQSYQLPFQQNSRESVYQNGG